MIDDGKNDSSGGSYEISVEFLKERVDDPSLPFGHGYVLAGLIAGIEPEAYIN